MIESPVVTGLAMSYSTRRSQSAPDATSIAVGNCCSPVAVNRQRLKSTVGTVPLMAVVPVRVSPLKEGQVR